MKCAMCWLIIQFLSMHSKFLLDHRYSDITVMWVISPGSTDWSSIFLGASRECLLVNSINFLHFGTFMNIFVGVKSTIFDDPIIQSQWFWLMSFIMVEECWTRLGKQITMFLSSTPDVCLSKSTIFTGKKPRKKVHESWLKSLGFKWKQKTTNKQKIRHLSWCSWPIPKFSWENQQKTPRASRPCAAFQVIQRPPRERSTRRMGTFESWSEHGQIPKT